jgi:hypothetical protein
VAAFGRWGGWILGLASGLLGLAWLKISALRFLSRRRISAAVEAAWTRLHLGAAFYLARAVGLLSGLGMLIIALALGGTAPRRCQARDRRGV